MPYILVERYERTYDFSGTATPEIFRVPAGNRVIGCAVKVNRVENGNGTMTFGRSGDTDGYMTDSDIVATVAGVKDTASGVDLAGNGHNITTEQSIVAAYSAGTNSVHPNVTFTLLVMKDNVWNKLR